MTTVGVAGGGVATQRHGGRAGISAALRMDFWGWRQFALLLPVTQREIKQTYNKFLLVFLIEGKNKNSVG